MAEFVRRGLRSEERIRQDAEFPYFSVPDDAPRITQKWFHLKAAKSFRTCPITQTGFVRISSNPSFTPNPPSTIEAMALLGRIMKLPGHGLWPDDLSLVEAFGPTPLLTSHQQVTDGYLLALAIAHGGLLATLDRGIAVLARQSPEHLELVLSGARRKADTLVT